MKKLQSFQALFGQTKVLIGMVHLLPLPGSPGYGGDFGAIEARAGQDARTLQEAGFDALLVENYGDMPFYPDRVPAETVAAMAALCVQLRSITPIPLGVNVLRNDARAAMAVATVAGAKFVRVNVHTGVAVSDQGLLCGRAHETLRLRRSLQSNVAVFADVAVKHAEPLGHRELEELATEAVERGLADAVILTGGRTAEPVAMEQLIRLKETLPDVPVIAGSGVTEATVAEVLSVADGVIVGTSIKVEGDTAGPVDSHRARALVRAAGGR